MAVHFSFATASLAQRNLWLSCVKFFNLLHSRNVFIFLYKSPLQKIRKSCTLFLSQLCASLQHTSHKLRCAKLAAVMAVEGTQIDYNSFRKSHALGFSPSSIPLPTISINSRAETPLEFFMSKEAPASSRNSIISMFFSSP